MLRILMSFLTICTFSVFLHACNTIEGAGEDIEAGGEAISGTAQDAKN